jgi:hypothetical protein
MSIIFSVFIIIINNNISKSVVFCLIRIFNRIFIVTHNVCFRPCSVYSYFQTLWILEKLESFVSDVNFSFETDLICDAKTNTRGKCETFFYFSLNLFLTLNRRSLIFQIFGFIKNFDDSKNL